MRFSGAACGGQAEPGNRLLYLQNPCYLGRLDPPHGLLRGGSFDRARNQAPARRAVELHRHVVLEELADFAVAQFADPHQRGLAACQASILARCSLAS